jgi:hypothetical protein
MYLFIYAVWSLSHVYICDSFEVIIFARASKHTKTRTELKTGDDYPLLRSIYYGGASKLFDYIIRIRGLNILRYNSLSVLYLCMLVIVYLCM